MDAPSIEQLMARIRAEGDRNRAITQPDQDQQQAELRRAMQAGTGGVNTPARFLSGNQTDFGEISDPIGQIAARIGQLRSRQRANQNNPSADPHSRDIANDEIAPLQALLDSYMGKMQGQAQQATAAPRDSSPQGAGFAENPSVQRAQFQMDMQRQQPQTRVVDPYADVRSAAIKAAMKYLNMNNPHLLSSLR